MRRISGGSLPKKGDAGCGSAEASSCSRGILGAAGFAAASRAVARVVMGWLMWLISGFDLLSTPRSRMPDILRRDRRTCWKGSQLRRGRLGSVMPATAMLLVR